VKVYVKASRAKGCVVNTCLVAGGMGIVKIANPGLLKNNSHPHDKEFLSKRVGQSLLIRMSFVKCRGTTTAKINPENFDTLREAFLDKIFRIIEFGD